MFRAAHIFRHKAEVTDFIGVPPLLIMDGVVDGTQDRMDGVDTGVDTGEESDSM